MQDSQPGSHTTWQRPTSLLLHRLYYAGWVLFVSLFLISGAVGHDPWWKRGEAYTFGIVYHFYITHSWLIPINAGQPFMEKPPLFYWTCVIMCKLLGSLLPLHDAARLASVFYSTISAFFIWKSADVLFFRHPERDILRTVTLFLFFGNYGLIHFSHAMATDIALLAGTSIILYGMALLCMQPSRFKTSGIILGTGLGIAFLSKGLIMPCTLTVSGIILYSSIASLRTRHTTYALGIALLVFLPFLIIWPLLVYQYSPSLFMQWFWENNIGRFIGFSVPALGAANRPFYFLWLAPIFAFPTFLMACAQIILARKQWRTPEYLLPVSIAITGMAVLLLSASGRAPYLLPLMPAFALLAAPLLLQITVRFLKYWNYFTYGAFSITILLTWLLWWDLLQPAAHRPLPFLANLFDKWLPADFVFTEPQPLACTVALFAGLIWITTFKNRQATALNTARIWFIGAAALWCTTHTILLPWINENRSYRPALTRLLDYVQNSPHPDACIGNFHVGENIAPMMQYFTGKEVAMPMQDWDGHACPLLLVFSDKNVAPDIHTGWRMLWSESRMRDMRNMELRLYERTP